MSEPQAEVTAPALTARGHALRVATLDALTDIAAGALAQARAEAQPVLAEKRRNGDGNQQTAMLPDGTEVGVLSIKSGATTVSPDEDALLAWVAEHCPGELEDFIDPAAWSNVDVVDLVKAAFPQLVKTRVRESARKKLLTEARAKGGKVTNADGEFSVIASVVPHLPTGEFAYKPKDGAAQRIVAEWLAGRLEVPGMQELLALPRGGDPGDE